MEAVVYESKNTRLIIPLGQFIHPRDLPKLPIESDMKYLLPRLT